MTSPPTISPKFLANGDDLGVVAVGFSGGQVANTIFGLSTINAHQEQCKPGVDAAPSALISSDSLRNFETT